VKDTVINHFSAFGGTALTRANVITTFIGGAHPSSVRIIVQYKFKWITPIRSLVGAMKDTLKAQAEYRYEF
jgi:hypothetical protein